VSARPVVIAVDGPAAAGKGSAVLAKHLDQAIKQLTAAGVDVNGSSYAPITVELQEGGA
jgi:cytidylate kinase